MAAVLACVACTAWMVRPEGHGVGAWIKKGEAMRAVTLDCPYYTGDVTVDADEVVAVIRGGNGGATLVLKSGANIRVIDNDKVYAAEERLR